ncbi:Integrase, catalytic core [Corchorus capsularis]|uniref:Integrase, catalytic core n=1 Tax=Corchorus capsularis TaxID=210143 RepID=A0A1R3G121_COCAP|nr:Integrase, catalytic core [Corchorus capsularis]
MSTSNPTIPGIVPTPHIFTGENYQTWSVKMQTFLQAHGMRGVVEGKDPYVLPDNPTVKQMKYHETETAKAFKALQVIQNNVFEVIFNLIMTCKTPKEAWDMLKAEFEGSDKVRRLQERIVMKLVDTLPAKYEAKLSSLEDTRDMSTVSLYEIVNALQAFEQRQAARDQDSIEGAFSVKGKEKAQSSGKGKKIQKKGKGKKQESSGGNEMEKKQKQLCKYCKRPNHAEKDCWFNPDSTCSKCNQNGHMEKVCKNKQQQHKRAQVAEDDENHEEQINVDLSYNSKVRIGNGEYLEVKGKGDIVVSTPKGNKVISDVLYVLEIDVNLISVGQLLERGYKVVFSDNACTISDSTGVELMNVKMRNRSFSLKWKEPAAYAAFDNDSNLWHMRLRHHRSEAAGIFRNFKIWIETQSECKIKVLRSDNGTEYTSESFEEFLKATGVEHQLTVTYTPQQNGVSERKTGQSWRWQEAKRSKLDGKAEVCIFVGYGTNVKRYRVFNPKTSKIAVSRDVTFKESALWNWEKSEAEVPDVVLPSNVQQQAEPDQYDDENVDDPAVRGTRSLDEIYSRCSVAVLEPNSFTKASKSQKWVAAMEEEMRMIEKNHTWELVQRPQEKNVIGVKWIFKTKLNPDGGVNRHKARLVVKGYAQSYGIDYTETFAPVARLDTIRLLLAMAAQNQWRIHQMDVKSAFLNGNLQEEIYVEQPEGFLVKGSEEKVYLLKKALYGLKQAPRACSVLVEKFKEEMEKVFEMSDLGEMSYFLGMEVTQNQQGIFIGQQKFAKEILMKFQRPDIMFSVSLLSRFMHEPTENHLRAAKRVLRYLKGSLSFGVMFSKVDKAELVGFSDSDWAGSTEDMKSTSGYAFTLGSGVFSWKSKKQETVVQSTAEAEYIAASEAVNQAIWLKRVCADIKLSVAKNPVKINVDNQSAIAIAKNPVFHSRTKHIKIKFHYVREMEHEGEGQAINMQYHIRDPISSLPEDIVGNILSRLTMKEAMRTNILSSNWQHLWTNFSGFLDFDVSLSKHKILGMLMKEQLEAKRMDFINWVNRALERIQSPTIEGFRVSFDVQSKPDVDSWITFAISGLSTLSSLCLKRVDLTEEVINSVLTNCPSLEILRVQEAVVLKRFRISDPSISLKCLELTGCRWLEDAEISGVNLVSFKFTGLTVDIRYKNLPRRLAKLSLGALYVNKVIVEELEQVLRFRMQLETLVLDVNTDWMAAYFPKYLPEFTILRHFELGTLIVAPGHSLLPFTSLLKASPLLHKFTLRVRFCWEQNLPPFTEFTNHHSLLEHVYPCLKVVELKGFLGFPAEMEILFHLLHNAPALENLTIDVCKPRCLGSTIETLVRDQCQIARLRAVELQPKLPPKIDFLVI